jgi:two-component system sensor histidine kinase KdpD
MDGILRTAGAQVGRIFNAEVAILPPRSGKVLAQAHPCSTFTLDEKDFGVASWVFEHGRPAGRFTDSLPSASAQFLPLLTTGRTVGVMGIRTHAGQRLSIDQEIMLETFSNQIALVIERELLDEAAEQAAMLRESERLYTALLNSISHELRTPIATIAGAAGILRDPQTAADTTAREELTLDIQEAAERLNRLVENLLDMSRLDSGRLQLKLDWCDVGDVISVAVKRLERDLAKHPLVIEYATDLPLVRMDFVLIEQVLVNLLDNAASYTPPGAPIKILSSLDGKFLLIEITDSGPGIPEEDLERIFDKFYRVPGTATGGTGLGLSICRGLVEAHGGTLKAENASGREAHPEGARLGARGARFIVSLPVGTPPPPVREAAL